MDVEFISTFSIDCDSMPCGIDAHPTVARISVLNKAKESMHILASHGDTSIDVEGVSGDVIDGRIQGEESAHTRNLRGFSQSLEGNSGRDLFEVGGVEFFHHVCFDESRADGVDNDVAGGEFFGVRHTHGDDTSLCGGVVGLSGVSELSDDRRDIDDASGSLLGGQLEEGLCAVKDAAQVGINDGLPGIWFHSHDESITGDSGVVDQYVDGSESLDGFRKEFLDRIGIGGCRLNSGAFKMTTKRKQK